MVTEVPALRTLRLEYEVSGPVRKWTALITVAEVSFISETVSAGDPKTTAIYLAGALASALTGAGAIRLIVLIARKNKFIIFSLYSLAAGSAAMIAGFLV